MTDQSISVMLTGTHIEYIDKIADQLGSDRDFVIKASLSYFFDAWDTGKIGCESSEDIHPILYPAVDFEMSNMRVRIGPVTTKHKDEGNYPLIQISKLGPSAPADDGNTFITLQPVAEDFIINVRDRVHSAIMRGNILTLDTVGLNRFRSILMDAISEALREYTP